MRTIATAPCGSSRTVRIQRAHAAPRVRRERMQRPGCRERMQRLPGCAASACGAPRAHAAPSRVRRERMQRRCSASACRASGAASACSAHAPRAHAAPSERMQRPGCAQSACSVPGAPWDPDRVRLRAALVVPRWHYRTRAACSATGSTCTTSVHARQLLKAASTARQDVLAVPGARCQRRGQLLKVSTPARARTAHLTGLEAHADSRCPSQRDTTDPARAMLSWRCSALSRKHACSRLQHACW